MRGMGVNTGIGITFLVLSSFWLNLIFDLPNAHGLASFGPDFFPELIVLCMMGIAVSLIINDLRHKNKTEAVQLNPKDMLRVLLAIFVSAAYIYFLPIVGYLASTVVALFLLLLLFGLRKKIAVILLTLLVPGGLYLLFEVVLKVLLP